MAKMNHNRIQNRMIIIFVLALWVGLFLNQSKTQIVGASPNENDSRGAEPPTPTKTSTPITFNIGPGDCYARKKSIQAWLARATGGPSTNFVCGKLQIVQDNKTKKDVLVLEPCGRGSYYVFKVRPDELHDYYQFMNVQFENGEKVYTEDYGILTKYIKSFSGYYVLENCQGCGIKPVYISTAEIIFPTSTGLALPMAVYPTVPSFPTQAEILPFNTPTPTPMGWETSLIPAPVSTTESVSPLPGQTIPTVAPTMAVYLTLMDLKISQENPIMYQDIELQITVQNLGFPIDKPAWEYTGKVVLRSADGKAIEEIDFTSDRSSSIKGVESVRVQAETWEITVPLRFSQSVQDGEIEVFVQPLDSLTYIYPRSVKIPITVQPEIATLTPTSSYTSQEIAQPTAVQTEPALSRSSLCLGLNVAFLAPVIAILFFKTRTRRIS